jgi:hypothetical protein
VKRLMGLSLAIVAMFAIAACGGGDDDGGDDSNGDNDAPDATATADNSGGDNDDDGDNDGDNDDDGDDDGDGAAFAKVTIGSDSWEFDLASQFSACIALGGAIGAVGPGANGIDVDVDITLPPEDWESQSDDDGWDAPSVRVDDDVNDRQWRAGGDIINDILAGRDNIDGVSQVDSFSIDGGTASGTATFIDMRAVTFAAGDALPDSVQGSFEVSCG